jgi:WD40 repeat protein
MILNAAGGPWNGRPPRNSLLSWAETWTEKHCRAALSLEQMPKEIFAHGEVTAAFSNHRTSVSDFSWNPMNPLEIASVCGAGARTWRIDETEPFARFDWGGASLLATWSPDGRRLVTGDQTPSVHLSTTSRENIRCTFKAMRQK